MKVQTAVIVLAGFVTSAAGQTFVGLGFLPGDTQSRARALSADGLSVAGDGQPNAPFGDARACWRWRAGTGLQDLGGSSINVTSMSADGSVIVGSFLQAPGNLPAFRWTETSGVQLVSGVYRALLPSPGVSDDGHVLVGATTTGGSDPVRWTEQTGPVVLPDAPLTGNLVRADVMTAYATNADGSVVVGSMFARRIGEPQASITPFRWMQSTGTSEMLTLPSGDYVHGAARWISYDGNTIIALAESDVFRWRPDTGFTLVPQFAGNVGLDLSGDGNTIVCNGDIWNVNTGTRPLTTILTEAGCDFSGWSSLVVTGVDFDGNTFCGYGTHQGLTEAWYATVPAPASVAALAIIGLSAASRRRQSSSLKSQI